MGGLLSRVEGKGISKSYREMNLAGCRRLLFGLNSSLGSLTDASLRLVGLLVFEFDVWPFFIGAPRISTNFVEWF